MFQLTFNNSHLHFNYTDLEIIKNLCLTLHFRSNYRLQLLLYIPVLVIFPMGESSCYIVFSFRHLILS